jgi:hypothetical protein
MISPPTTYIASPLLRSMSPSISELKQLYFKLITTIVPGPASWSYFIPLLLLPLGLLVPPSTLSHGQLCAMILPTSLAATAHAWLTLGGTDVISTDCLYMTLFLYVFKDPRQEFKRVVKLRSYGDLKCTNWQGQKKSKRNEDIVESEHVFLETYPEVFSDRLTWAMMLLQSRPLHDWIIGNTGHDRRTVAPFQHPTRLSFTVNVLSRLLPVLLVFLPLSKQLAMDDPYFSDPYWSISSPYQPSSTQTVTTTFLRSTIPPFVLRPLTMAMYAYSLLLGLFLPPILMPVLLSAMRLIPEDWSPHTWHPQFGPFYAILDYGVRGFWGQWWHQQMRHIVSEPGRWLAAKFGLGNTGWEKTIKYILICVSAFTLSGITHLGMVPSKPRFATVDANELRFRLASFFWVQPIGIAVELLVIAPVLKNLPSSAVHVERILRVMWTIAWMCSTCVFLVVPFGQLGYWKITPSYSLPRLP